MNSSGMTARDVPEVRLDLAEWAAGRGGQIIASRGGGALGPVLATSLKQAELYYVNADMTTLARQIGQGLDVYALASDDLPERHGLLVWDAPATGEHAGTAPVAVSWTSSGARVFVSLYASAPAYRQWCKEFSPQAVKDAQLVTAGRLVFRGRGPTLQLDGPDTPWERLGCGDHEEATRTLLATFILIAQPVEARRSLHETEDVLPSRGAQKRIQRAGGDPTKAVRTVTLRQSLRPTTDDERATEHATRIYRHRWFVKAHRRTYPNRDHPEGKQRKWVGPYLVVPAGCEDAPLIGGERVNVLRR